MSKGYTRCSLYLLAEGQGTIKELRTPIPTPSLGFSPLQRSCGYHRNMGTRRLLVAKDLPGGGARAGLQKQLATREENVARGAAGTPPSWPVGSHTE